jgi:hypothetical protein
VPQFVTTWAILRKASLSMHHSYKKEEKNKGAKKGKGI